MKRFLTLALGSITVAVTAMMALGCQSAAPSSSSPPPPAATQPAASQAAPQQAAKPAAASSYPTRGIDLIVPYAPGGGSGITAETINKIVTEEKLSPQPLNIQYKPGASGAIGWAYVAGRKGDPYTIATVTASFINGPVLGQSPLKLEEFTPIALQLLDQNLLVTFPNSPFKGLKDVVDAAKKTPKSVKVAGTGAAGSDAIVAALVEQAAGIKFNMIPFDSGAEVNAAILGGQVDIAISNPNEFLPNIQAGKLRPLGVASEERMPTLKDVPTLKELGYDVVFVTGRGITAPAGIGAAERDWLADMMKKVTQSKIWKDYADQNSMTIKYLGPDEYRKWLADETEKLIKIFKSMGVIK